MTTHKYMGRDVVQITGVEWCEPDDYSNSYWNLSSRRNNEPISTRERPVKKAKKNNSRSPANICYQRYKEDERKAVEAANKGDMLTSYQLFTSAAAGRKKYWERFYGNNPDDGHYAKWLCNIGSAWIQREAYENAKLEDKIGEEYNRENLRPRKFSAFWARKNMDVRAKKGIVFKQLLREHENIRKK